VLAAVAATNAWRYPAVAGYDFVHHQGYVDVLLEKHRLPTADETRAYDKPPLFYVYAAGVEWIAGKLGLSRPERAVQLMNVPLLLGAALLVLAFARLTWPGRRALHVAAAGFFAFVPLVVKAAAMVYPGTLALFLAAASLFLTGRLLHHDRFRPRLALVLAGSLLLGALTMAASLWILGGTVVALLLALRFAPPGARRGAARALLAVAALLAVGAGAWLARNPEARARAFLAGGYPGAVSQGPDLLIGTGVPSVFTAPERAAYANELIPTTYSDIWGDDLGVWAWGEWFPAHVQQQSRRAPQNWVGILPTLLAVAGWLAICALLVRTRVAERQALAVVAVAPVLAFAGMAYYAYSFPSPDSDTINARFLVTTAPLWAVAFGFAFDALARGRVARIALSVALVALALVDLRFLVFGRPLDPLL
jgi:hypothetical protein